MMKMSSFNSFRGNHMTLQLAEPLGKSVPSYGDDVIFACDDLTKTYRGKRVNFVLQPLDLTLRLGEITAVVGENGNGKTTLLKLIAGEHGKDGGEMRYPQFADGKPTDWYAIKQNLSYIPQEIPRWYGTVREQLVFCAATHGVAPEKIDALVDFLIGRLRLARYVDARWTELSGGYKMRFALAKALVKKPRLLIIDEPLANLDVNAQVVFLDDLRSFATTPGSPMAVILTSQHLHEVERISDNIIFMRDGHTLYSGQTHSFGDDRGQNSYELATPVSLDTLQHLARRDLPEATIEQNGYNFIIRTPVSIDRADVLQFLIQNDVTPDYFRDISKSTRRLFTE